MRKGLPPLRNLLQGAFILYLLHIGWQFNRFVNYYQKGSQGIPPNRPPSVEAFLPISALIALKSWLVNHVFDPIHPAGLTILLSIITISLMFKRGFCSWMCPIGAASEGLEKLGKRVFETHIKLPRTVDILFMLPKYLILVFFLKVVFFDMSGSTALEFLNNPYNKIADAKMLVFWTNPGPATLKIMGLLVLTSLLVKNFWCRYLCPYGALLGMVSRFSPLKVERNQAKCINCGSCTRACPNRITVENEKRVYSVECTSCLECVKKCPTKALSIKSGILPRAAVNPSHYPVFLLGLFFFIIMIAMVTGHWETSLKHQDYASLIPIMEGFSH